jgi:hypothetical protein
MATRNYALFEEAMRRRKQIVCTYRGRRRELCAIILGYTKGEERALTFQFGGQSNSTLPPQGEWRCLSLSEVSDIQLREGDWHSGPRHTMPQTCVEDVDVDVNPFSPYYPKRRI